MFFEAPLPTWKQILRHNVQRTNKTFFEEISDEVLFFSEPYTAIGLILHAIKNAGNKERVIVLVPEFFRKKAASILQADWVETVYYPVGSDLNPKWEYIKEWAKENKFDAFVFSHFFGKFFESISRAKDISKNRGALLIEDCTHVLYPMGKTGASGDFVIYCPHKQLPVMDGEVLFYNNKSQNPFFTDVLSEIKRQYDGLQEETTTAAWWLRKSLQKISPSRKALPIHACRYDKNAAKRIWKPKKISRASYNTLCDYTYSELKKAAYIRRNNLDMMNYIMSRSFPAAKPLLGPEVDVPFAAAYLIDNEQEKRKIAKEMINTGLTLLQLADPPCSFTGDEGQEQAKSVFEDIILLPIHQTITPQMLVKKYL